MSGKSLCVSVRCCASEEGWKLQAVGKAGNCSNAVPEFGKNKPHDHASLAMMLIKKYQMIGLQAH